MYAEYHAEAYFLLDGREGCVPDDSAMEAHAGNTKEAACDELGRLEAYDSGMPRRGALAGLPDIN